MSDPVFFSLTLELPAHVETKTVKTIAKILDQMVRQAREDPSHARSLCSTSVHPIHCSRTTSGRPGIRILGTALDAVTATAEFILGSLHDELERNGVIGCEVFPVTFALLTARAVSAMARD